MYDGIQLELKCERLFVTLAVNIVLTDDRKAGKIYKLENYCTALTVLQTREEGCNITRGMKL